MSRFNSLRSVACAAVFLLGIGVTPIGNAAPPLEKLDWKSPGDQLILHDTNTDLRWLDLSQTLNRSVNDLMGQWFGNTDIFPLVGSFAGFRYATKTEVAQLYADFGITVIDNSYSSANWVGANVAFQALGITGSNGSVRVQEGLSIDSPGVANSPEIVTGFYTNTARAFVFPTPTLNNFNNFDAKKTSLGSYLVMIMPVPEPETYAMMLAGLGLVGVAARRRKPAKG